MEPDCHADLELANRTLPTDSLCCLLILDRELNTVDHHFVALLWLWKSLSFTLLRPCERPRHVAIVEKRQRCKRKQDHFHLLHLYLKVRSILCGNLSSPLYICTPLHLTLFPGTFLSLIFPIAFSVWPSTSHTLITTHFLRRPCRWVIQPCTLLL